MNNSLLSYFKGVLFGAAVGERIGTICEQATQRGLSSHQVIRALDRGLGSAASDVQSIGKFTLALHGAESLIQEGDLDLADWHQRLEQVNLSHLLPTENLSCSEVAVATLPIALFYHEMDGKLQQNLYRVAQQWLRTSEPNDGVLIVGTAIAQSLQGRLNPATAIAQMVRILDASGSSFIAQLAQVQTLVDEGAGIEQARAQLVQPDAALSGSTPIASGSTPIASGSTPIASGSTPIATGSTPIAIALYCFLSTPEALQLSVLRAARIGYQPTITCALTGALSGSWNGANAIPLGWQLNLGKSYRLRLPEQESAQGKADIDLAVLAQRLLAVWSGVYDLDRVAVGFGDGVAIAAPNVIRTPATLNRR